MTVRTEPEGAPLFRLHYENRDRLPTWTVYRSPLDYPDNWVARMFLTLPEPQPTFYAVIGDSLEEVRRALPLGLWRIDRSPGDEPQIVETWL